MTLVDISICVLFLFLGPLIFFGILFFLPCLRRCCHPAWIVFFPMTQSFFLAKINDDEEENEEEKEGQRKKEEKQQQQDDAQESMETLGDTDSVPQPKSKQQTNAQQQPHKLDPPTRCHESELGCCGRRRFRLDTSEALATALFNAAAVVVVAVGCFGFGRVWLLDYEQKSKISDLENWRCVGATTPTSERRSCDAAVLAAAAAAAVKKRDWTDIASSCSRIPIEILYYGCTGQTQFSRRKRGAANSSSPASAAASIVADITATARVCCNAFPDGCWLPTPGIQVTGLGHGDRVIWVGNRIIGRCLSRSLCDRCAFSHCNCSKVAAEAAAAAADAECANRRRVTDACEESDVLAAVETAMRDRFLAEMLEESVTKKGCDDYLKNKLKKRAVDAADAAVEDVYRRVVRVVNVTAGVGDFCYRWRPNWKEALIGAAVGIGLFVGFSLVFQMVANFVVLVFLDAESDEKRSLLRRSGVNPQVRKWALPVFVILASASVAALHLAFCGVVDGVVVTQDVVLVVSVVVVVLTGILLPWEDATPMPS